MNPLVSIIIPTYNRAHLIGETLDSISAQTYTNWECIVVDDGSTDSTISLISEYCKKDERFQLHHRPKDRPSGGNAARNYGFQVSKGAYIQWFDDDDLMLEDYLKARLELFKDDVNVVICSGNIVNEHLELIKTINLKTSVNLYKEYALWKYEIYTPSILFKRDFIRKYVFNEKIVRGQETELFTRAFYELKMNEYVIINKPLFSYRQHFNSKTEESKLYVKAFKENLFYISKSNFKRALELRDKVLVYFYYKLLVKQLFRSIDNNHLSNAKNIVKCILKELSVKNTPIKIKIIFIGGIYAVFRKGNIMKSHLRDHKMYY